MVLSFSMESTEEQNKSLTQEFLQRSSEEFIQVPLGVPLELELPDGRHLKKCDPLKPRDAKMVDEKGNTAMTEKYIRQLCKQQKAYLTPELNDKLYLHFQGFAKIENLEAYTGLKSLWLEGNGIEKIENLGHLSNLKCLFLHQNCIKTIENLPLSLDTLNLSQNMISKLSGLKHLPYLSTLQLANNYLTTSADIEELADCASVSVLDLSHNKIEDPEIIDVLSQMQSLRVLILTGNPVIRQIQSYRKSVLSRIPNLTYLDERPVFPEERLQVEAWERGGIEAEREERARQKQEKIDEQQRSFEAMIKFREQAKFKRLEETSEE